MIDDNEFQKYNIGSDELYLPLCNDDVNRVHLQKYQMYLNQTDKKILQRLREQALKITLTLSDEEYLILEQYRQYAVEQIRLLRQQIQN
jgi:hypothetical protein